MRYSFQEKIEIAQNIPNKKISLGFLYTAIEKENKRHKQILKKIESSFNKNIWKIIEKNWSSEEIEKTFKNNNIYK